MPLLFNLLLVFFFFTLAIADLYVFVNTKGWAAFIPLLNVMVFACLQMYFANKADNQINKLQAKREKEIDDNKR